MGSRLRLLTQAKINGTGGKMPSGRNIPITGLGLLFKSHITKKKPSGGKKNEHTPPGLSKDSANTIDSLSKASSKMDIIPAAFLPPLK